MRRRFTMLLSVLLLAACGGSTGMPTPGADGQGQANGGRAPSLPAQDAGVLQALLSDGVDPADAQLLAYTRTEVTSDAPGTAKVVQRLVSGDVITFSVAVSPGASGPAGQLHSRTSVHEHGFAVHLDYVVGLDGLTDDVRKSLDGIASTGRHLANVTTGVRPLLTAAGTGFVSVTVDWAIEEARDTVRDGLIEEAVKKIASGAESSVVNYLKAGLALQEGLELGAEMDALLAQLDKLEACARNPTSPLTQKAYAADPALLPGILSQIEEARFDIKANTFVMDVGVLNKTLAGAGPKWLGFVVGPGTAWSKTTLQAHSKELVADVYNRIPRCMQDCPYASAQAAPASGGGSSPGGSGGSAGGAVQACVMPQTIVGSVSYTLTDENGLIWYRGDATGLLYRWDPATEHYKLAEGRLHWTVDVIDPGMGCQDSGLHYFGSGTEPLVPDGEPPMHGGEAVVGPGAPDEIADIGVVWGADGVNPSPATYYVHATVRIHDPVHVEDECGPREDITEASKEGYLWFELGPDQQPEIHDGVLDGTATYDDGSGIRTRTYKWSLKFGP